MSWSKLPHRLRAGSVSNIVLSRSHDDNSQIYTNLVYEKNSLHDINSIARALQLLNSHPGKISRNLHFKFCKS